MTAPASDALEILHRVFGYESFRGQQAAIVQRVIEGGDALVLMPTGGGKSLCYQIPALVREGTGVVISPLIALMQDQVDALSAVGVRAAFLNSTQDLDERRRVEAALLAGELDLVYLAPERLSADSTFEAIAPFASRQNVKVSIEDAGFDDAAAFVAGEVNVEFEAVEGRDIGKAREGDIEGTFRAPLVEETVAEANLALLDDDGLLGLPLGAR